MILFIPYHKALFTSKFYGNETIMQLYDKIDGGRVCVSPFGQQTDRHLRGQSKTGHWCARIMLRWISKSGFCFVDFTWNILLFIYFIPGSRVGRVLPTYPLRVAEGDKQGREQGTDYSTFFDISANKSRNRRSQARMCSSASGAQAGVRKRNQDEKKEGQALCLRRVTWMFCLCVKLKLEGNIWKFVRGEESGVIVKAMAKEGDGTSARNSCGNSVQEFSTRFLWFRWMRITKGGVTVTVYGPDSKTSEEEKRVFGGELSECVISSHKEIK